MGSGQRFVGGRRLTGVHTGLCVPPESISRLNSLLALGVRYVETVDGTKIDPATAEDVAMFNRAARALAVGRKSTEVPYGAPDQRISVTEGSGGGASATVGCVATGVAAKRLGVSEARVRQLLRSRRLAGHQTGRVWMVDADDLDRMIQERQGEP